MAITLRKQKHHISNKCTSSPASMSIFTSNIKATQTASALQQQPRQPRHVEYALQPNTTAPHVYVHQVHSLPHNIAAHHFTISQLSLSTSSSLPPCPCNLCLRWYMCLGRGTAIATTTRAVPHHPEGDTIYLAQIWPCSQSTRHLRVYMTQLGRQYVRTHSRPRYSSVHLPEIRSCDAPTTIPAQTLLLE